MPTICKLYGVAASVFFDMRHCVDVVYPEGQRPATYAHTMEQLERFLDAFVSVVMRRPSETKSEVELLENAEQYLMAATVNWPGDDWV